MALLALYIYHLVFFFILAAESFPRSSHPRARFRNILCAEDKNCEDKVRIKDSTPYFIRKLTAVCTVSLGVLLSPMKTLKFVDIDLGASSAYAVENGQELELYNEEVELALKSYSESLNLKPKYSAKRKTPVPARVPSAISDEMITDSRERVLTLKAYLDEVERDLFTAKDTEKWNKLQIYLNTFYDQENSFAALIKGLFPSSAAEDTAAREAMSFEAREMFLALDELKDSVKDKELKESEKYYAKLILSYDRFLKAGDLYPTYDPITSTEVFFTETKTPITSLRYNTKDAPKILDRVLLINGPDMGKLGTVIWIIPEEKSAIIKLDKDGRQYQEVKTVKLESIAVALEEG